MFHCSDNLHNNPTRIYTTDAASIISSSEDQVLDNGVDAKLICEVDAEPFTDS